MNISKGPNFEESKNNGEDYGINFSRGVGEEYNDRLYNRLGDSEASSIYEQFLKDPFLIDSIAASASDGDLQKLANDMIEHAPSTFILHLHYFKGRKWCSSDMVKKASDMTVLSHPEYVLLQAIHLMPHFSWANSDYFHKVAKVCIEKAVGFEEIATNGCIFSQFEWYLPILESAVSQGKVVCPEKVLEYLVLHKPTWSSSELAEELMSRDILMYLMKTKPTDFPELQRESLKAAFLQLPFSEKIVDELLDVYYLQGIKGMDSMFIIPWNHEYSKKLFSLFKNISHFDTEDTILQDAGVTFVMWKMRFFSAIRKFLKEYQGSIDATDTEVVLSEKGLDIVNYLEYIVFMPKHDSRTEAKVMVDCVKRYGKDAHRALQEIYPVKIS